MSSLTKIKVGNITYNIKDTISGYITAQDINIKQDTFQYSNMPVATAADVGKIIQYTGVTDANYRNGYFYKCVNNSGVYTWQKISVQPGGEGTIVTDVLQNGASVVNNNIARVTVPVATSQLTNDSNFITPDDLAIKQDVLVSGTNIKTINNQSLLGSGNIEISGGGGGTEDYNQLSNRPQINGVVLTGNKTTGNLNISYTDLTNKPTIPTMTSQLTNNSGFITSIPNASDVVIGGLKVYFDPTTEYLYITNNGSSPRPN